MDIKRLFRAILVVFLVVVLTGQTSCPLRRTSTETSGTGALAPVVYTGTKALEMTFVNNMPPTRIYTTMPLNIMVELRNRGATKIDNGKLFLSGYDPNIIKIDNQKNFNVEGKTRFNLEGGFTTVTFSTEAFGIRKELFTDFYKPKMVVSACYDYETDATAIVCIDPQRYEVEPGEKACVQQDVALSAGQGAPIAVSNVGVDTFGSETHIKMTISNVGSGTVFETGALSKCPTQLGYENLNYVKIAQVTLSGITGKCEPQDYRIFLTNKKGTIYCTFPVDATQQAYKSPLKILLRYGYMQSVSKDIEIVKV